MHGRIMRTLVCALGHAAEQVVNNPHAVAGVAVLNLTTVVRLLGSRTGGHAFGTRRGAAVLRWCTATRRRSMPPAEHIDEGAAFSPARRTPARRPHHARVQWEVGRRRRCGPTGGRTHLRPRHTRGRRASAARTRGDNQRTFFELPHEPLFCIGGGEVKGCFPTSPSSL